MNFTRVLQLIGAFFDSTGEPFGVIGALGVAAHGFSRTTFDIDIVAAQSVQPKLVEYLESEGFRTLHRSTGYSNHVHDDSELGRIDVVYVGGETRDKIFGGLSTCAGPGGIEIPVPRPEHLAAMKLFGIKNNPRRALQDLEDVARIMDLPGVDVAEIKAYFERYGLGELLDRLE
jgi:hypothetical protein